MAGSTQSKNDFGVFLQHGDPGFAAWLAFFALILATINVVGGFAVTNRMLNMIAGKRGGK